MLRDFGSCRVCPHARVYTCVCTQTLLKSSCFPLSHSLSAGHLRPPLSSKRLAPLCLHLSSTLDKWPHFPPPRATRAHSTSLFQTSRPPSTWPLACLLSPHCNPGAALCLLQADSFLRCSDHFHIPTPSPTSVITVAILHVLR